MFGCTRGGPVSRALPVPRGGFLNAAAKPAHTEIAVFPFGERRHSEPSHGVRRLCRCCAALAEEGFGSPPSTALGNTPASSERGDGLRQNPELLENTSSAFGVSVSCEKALSALWHRRCFFFSFLMYFSGLLT